jgi:hypothetical protein
VEGANGAEGQATASCTGGAGRVKAIPLQLLPAGSTFLTSYSTILRLSLLLFLISSHSDIEARGLLLDEIKKWLHLRVCAQRLDRIEVLRQILLAEERMNHAMTDFMQAYDGELFGVDFVAFLPPILLGVEVMLRHLTVERATAEGTSDTLYVSHMRAPPFRAWPPEIFLLVEKRAYGQPFHAK